MAHRPAAILLALGLLAGVVWSLSEKREAAPVEPGRVAPLFSLPDLTGEPLSLAGLQGQVVLVNFWATWCKPCEEEMPAMERLYQALREEGFELLAVSVDEDTEEVRAFRDRLALSFPILHDEGQQVARRYQSFRFPESFLIDREGLVVERYIGPREWDAPAYRARIARLLGR
ncbi:MAG: hypothetical protein CL910_00720 [Deltaproteobacteria bacterium]|jgi:peroxiredoxin|nr:hypothetical protein [Deltaproteobacteria bacterium]